MSNVARWAGAALAVAAILLALCFGSWLLSGCGAVRSACRAVDAVHHACTVIRYVGPDGGVEEVHVTGEDLAAFGEATRVHRAAARIADPQ